jgi:hypothetical protein
MVQPNPIGQQQTPPVQMPFFVPPPTTQVPPQAIPVTQPIPQTTTQATFTANHTSPSVPVQPHQQRGPQPIPQPQVGQVLHPNFIQPLQPSNCQNKRERLTFQFLAPLDLELDQAAAGLFLKRNRVMLTN